MGPQWPQGPPQWPWYTFKNIVLAFIVVCLVLAVPLACARAIF